eukprot:2288935-Rhodomonas_salina.1
MDRNRALLLKPATSAIDRPGGRGSSVFRRVWKLEGSLATRFVPFASTGYPGGTRVSGYGYKCTASHSAASVQPGTGHRVPRQPRSRWAAL